MHATRIINRSLWLRQAVLGVGLAALTMTFTGCNDAQSDALLGAGAGAIAGSVIGHNSGGHTAEGAAIGAGVGALTGYIIGNETDKAKQQQTYHGQPY